MSEETEPGAANRDLIVQDIVARTGIDEAMIERLVRTFYCRARRDPLIGPIFESKVHDWERHLRRLCAFWSSVALMSGRYHGQPMVAHLPLPIDSPRFDRWLEIFAETAREVCPPVAAAQVRGKRPGIRRTTGRSPRSQCRSRCAHCRAQSFPAGKRCP
jgi:hemoglobin